MGFPRQEYWSGLPFSSPGDLPNPGIEHTSPALQTIFFFLPLSHLGSPKQLNTHQIGIFINIYSMFSFSELFSLS